MDRSLAVRLQAERERQFVGRSVELQRFHRAISAPELPFCLWHVYGPGGIGKTTLLQALARYCQSAGIPHAQLDGRHIESVADSFLGTLRSHLQLPPTADVVEAIAEAGSQSGRYVLLIDTYEQLGALDTWLHQNFIAELPASTLVVLAGRQPPAPAWQMDAGWQALIEPLALRNFRPEESQIYLSHRQIPTVEHETILAFTHGHPLALSLVADIFAQGQGAAFQPEETPDLVKLLLERFVEQVPSRRHREALEACACVRSLSESLLGHLLDQPDVHALFNWLRQLSFMEAQSSGIFPHDVVREVLIADLRWRVPDWYETLHQRARRYYSDRLGKTQGPEQHRVLFDYIFLHRDHAAIRASFTWQETSSLQVTGLQDGDQTELLTLVKTHEGEASAALAADWLDQQPEGVLVFREAGQALAGFLIKVTLDAQTAATATQDPAIQSVWRYLQKTAPLRSGEVAVVFRFWMGKATYQAVSPVQSLIFITFVQHHRTIANLGYTFFCCAQPGDWEQMFAYADLERLPAADFTVSGRTYGVYGHDWRVLSPADWQALLAQRELTPAAQPERIASVVVLSQPDFEAAVRSALQTFRQPEALLKNPLLQSHLTSQPSETALSDRATALQALILEAADTLKTTPKQRKYYRALHCTYLDPAPTQEAAAEVLDLPFSTFRRHLKAGITEVTAFLWQREIG
ncbi:MAG: ATP-binding protein [Cyanobacteria bacterium P01_A01_bin.105]